MARKSRKVMEEQNLQALRPIDYNVAVYIRLSVEDNKKRGNSIESQRSIIENHIALNPDFEIYDAYIDNGTTGVNFERDGFKRMLGDIEAGKVNCVIVKDLSRLGRNAIDTGYYIQKYFPTKNVRFVSVNDNLDTNDKDNIHNGILLPLKNMINEAYSIDIGRKIRAQAEQSMKAGDFIGARPPYGYLKLPDNCHKLVIDLETAPVVRQIFEWAHDKVALNNIVLRLNEMNILPPSYYKQSKGLITHEKLLGNGKWQTRTVSVILADQVYAGDMVQGKTKSINHKQIPVNEEDWTVVQNTHEPIIDLEMFISVKAYRKQVAEESIRRGKTSYTENIFKGKIFCGCCGRDLHRHRRNVKNNPDAYCFYCLANSRVAKGTCEGVFIAEEELIPVVISILQKESEALTGKDFLMMRYDYEVKNRQEKIKLKISSLKQAVEKNRMYLKGLYEDFIEKLLSKSDYDYMKSNYETKISSAMNEIRELETEQKELEEDSVKYHDMADAAKKLKRKKAKLTSEMVDKLIEKITVESDKEVKIVFRFKGEFGGESEACV